MNRIRTDVLVIGAGAAGIRAAVEASACGAEVVLVNDAPVATSGSTFSRMTPGWGIQTLVDDEYATKNIELFHKEIMAVGRGVCDSKLARILVEESRARTNDLIDYGIRFRRTEDGKLYRATGCFSATERALITEDMDNVKEAFTSILQRCRVRILTGSVIDLIVENDRCQGAWCFDAKQSITAIDAGATVVAAGGGAAIYENHLCGPHSTGDGYALAVRSGAALSNMEFIQFMLGLKSGNDLRFLPRELLNLPNIMLDGNGRAVLETHLPSQVQRNRCVGLRQEHCPASVCDASFDIDLAVWHSRLDAGAVYWNVESDMRERWEVVHMAHAFNGGIHIDERAASSIPGLFAAGEAAAGPHGADRIGGCMMTATQVFGKRAGEFAARHAQHIGLSGNHISAWDQIPRLKKTGNDAEESDLLALLSKAVKQAMTRYANIVRTQRGLDTCRRILFDTACQLAAMEGATPANYHRYNKLRNMVDVAMQVVKHAMARPSSLGAHYRGEQDRTKGLSRGDRRGFLAINPFLVSTDAMSRQMIEWM